MLRVKVKSPRSAANTRPSIWVGTQRLINAFENVQSVETPVCANNKKIAAKSKVGAAAKSPYPVAMTTNAIPINRCNPRSLAPPKELAAIGPISAPIPRAPYNKPMLAAELTPHGNSRCPKTG
jgi:hypothetical protein